jgi:hypothetical protein
MPASLSASNSRNISVDELGILAESLHLMSIAASPLPGIGGSMSALIEAAHAMLVLAQVINSNYVTPNLVINKCTLIGRKTL